MTKGARAMAVAMLYPQTERGRGKKDPAKNAQKVGLFGNELLRQARTVLDHSRPLAESVLAGVKPLDVAGDDQRAVSFGPEAFAGSPGGPTGSRHRCTTE